jgi:isocitrate dehydrogenase kinase/phosphatase
MTLQPTGSQPFDRGAAIIEDAFLSYIKAFQRFTLQARLRFEARDWLGAAQDAADRLDVYASIVVRTVDHLHDLLDVHTRDKATWRAMKAAYLDRVNDRTDSELAETFFNSITRRVFTTVGVDSDLEFVAAGATQPDPGEAAGDVAEEFPCRPSLRDAVARLLRRHEFSVGYEELPRDAARVAQAIEAHCGAAGIQALQAVRAVFFRNKEAYLVGRVRTDNGDCPLAIALLNRSGRVGADAVLLTEDDVSIVFSFTRSYFFVDATRPAALVSFLRSIMPRKPVSELYSSLGHNKHGKTLFYRSLLHHLATTDEQFDIAPGARGMVMLVFTMPSFDAVFKIIRDRFAPPKTTTREEVMEKYRLVFRHDRAGRLVDAQEFEHLRFDRSRFSDALLAELAAEAAGTVAVTADSVVVRHVYTERKMTPLDLYLRSTSAEAARAAIFDYGQALRDLASTNIFPGDLLLKNFGVTRHGRLIFYDYDELSLLSDCRFRALPPPPDDEAETAAEPWYYVGPHDIFPEEFLPFLGLSPEMRDTFLASHGELLSPAFWWRVQEEHRAGVVPDVLPYGPTRRLRGGPSRPSVRPE